MIRLRAIHRPDLLAATSLALLAGIQLWSAAGPGRLPQNLDSMLEYVPNAAYLSRGLHTGHVPLWNPYQGTGMPFSADPGTGAWYLPNWPFLLLLPVHAAVRTAIWAHLIAAALGMYSVLRRLVGTSPAAAWIGAASFALTTWLPGLSGMAVVLTSIAWLPWIVLLAHLAALRGGRWIVMLAVAAGLQLVCGWPAGAYLTWLLAGGLVVPFAPVRSWIRLIGAGILATALAGILLVPAFELVRQTNYAETRPLDRVAQEGYLTLLSWFRPAGGTGSLESSQLYLGIAPLVLALAGATLGHRGWATRFALITVIALVVAAGTHAPLFAPLYRWLPGFRIVYLPARLGVVAAFALACLAALGADRTIQRGYRPRELALVALLAAGLPVLVLAQFWQSEGYDNFRRLLTNLGRFTGGPYLGLAQEAQYAVFAVATLGALALARTSGLRRRCVRTCLVALVAADLLMSQFAAHPPGFDPAAWYGPAQRTADALIAAVSHDRITGLQWHGDHHFLDQFPSGADPGMLPPNLATYAGVHDATAYNPLLLRSAASYFASVTLAERDDHWLWLDAFQADRAAALGLAGVLSSGAEWRIAGQRLTTPVHLAPDQQWHAIYGGPPFSAERLRAITYLGAATNVEQGTPAIELRLRSTAGEQQHWQLRAGIETAEWAYGRPDVRQAARHRQAPLALETHLQGAAGGRFAVYQYAAVTSLPPGSVSQVDARALVPGVAAYVDSLWIHGTVSYSSTALPGGLSLVRLPNARSRAALSGGTATITIDDAQRVAVVTNTSAGGTLVLADAVYPGWEATVDGNTVPIHVHDGLFRAVDVPSGQHEVVFSYRPRSLQLGAALTYLGLVACVLLLWRDRRRTSQMAQNLHFGCGDHWRR